MISGDDDSAAIVHVFRRLNRYADDLPEDYKDLREAKLSATIAASFAEHIREFAAENHHDVTVNIGEDLHSVEIAHSSGATVDIEVCGDEAFELVDWTAKFKPETEQLMIDVWWELDRSGLIFWRTSSSKKDASRCPMLKSLVWS